MLEVARVARLKRQQEREAALGVEVDRCTFCEGIYLDAGELEQVFSKRFEDRKAIWRRVLGL
jgi:Zn-finger nucleic acid-binding protein